jgi:hypothetical protein
MPAADPRCARQQPSACTRRQIRETLLPQPLAGPTPTPAENISKGAQHCCTEPDSREIFLDSTHPAIRIEFREIIEADQGPPRALETLASKSVRLPPHNQGGFTAAQRSRGLYENARLPRRHSHRRLPYLLSSKAWSGVSCPVAGTEAQSWPLSVAHGVISKPCPSNICGERR